MDEKTRCFWRGRKYQSAIIFLRPGLLLFFYSSPNQLYIYLCNSYYNIFSRLRSGAKKITITKIELSSKETCKRSDLARQLANESVLVEFAKGVEKNIVPCKKVIIFENNAKPFCTCQRSQLGLVDPDTFV